MPTEKCRRQTCELPAAENGYFCQNDWRIVPLETKHLLLAYPPEAVTDANESDRNKALHKALSELRAALRDYPTEAEAHAEERPQPSARLDAELVKVGIDPEESRNPTPPEEPTTTGRIEKRAAARKK